jgi:flagellar biosynthesis protein
MTGTAGKDPPVRLAVALHYEAERAPVVVAKGRGEVASKIMATAAEHGVAIEQNAPLAEALSTIELDSEIPEALYRAVAEVIAFVLRTKQHMRPG